MKLNFTRSAAASLLGVVLLVVALGFVAISTATEMAPESGGTYIEAIVGQPRYLNPILCQQNEPDEDISSLVFSGLTRIGEGGNIAPDLAQSWTISDQGRVYTFNLRKNVKWHDGEPFTADDVVFTVHALQDPDYQGLPEIADLWQDVQVSALNSETVQFTLPASYAPFLEYTSIGVLPAHLLKDVPATRLPENAFNSRPTGNGPFRVARANLAEVTLQASSVYHGRQPYLNRLVFRFYPDSRSALGALEKQVVQGLGRVPAESLAQVEQGRGHSMYSGPELSRLTLLILNNKYPPLADPNLRKAISYAVDRQAVIESTLSGEGQRAHSPIIPSSWAFKPDVSRYEYQPDTSRDLLEAAGWSDSDGDGVRERAGERLHLVLLTSDNSRRVKVASDIKRQLALVGIEVELQGATWVDLVKNFLVPHNYQMVLAEQSFPNADPDVYAFWHSSQSAEGLNFAGWSSRKADDLLERARQSTNQAEREPLYEAFQQEFADEEPSILLYYPVYTYAVSKEIKGVRIGALLSPADRFRYVDEWYVKTRLVFRQPGSRNP